MSDAPDPPDSHDPGSPDGDTAGMPAARMAEESVAGTATAVVQAPEPDAHAPPAQAATPSGPTAEQLALEAGWTMAVLYRKIEPIPTGGPSGLPTANELTEADRRKLEADRLGHLLQRLAAMPELTGSGLPTEVPAPDGNEAAWEEVLRKLNLDILCALAATRQQTQLAYELGRSLRDTANPPDQHPPTLTPSRVFARDRIATLQGWLAELSSELPPQAAAVVAISLGRWSEFAAITVGASSARLKNGDRTKLGETMDRYLLRQGDLWLMLLTGAYSTSGLLSPEGYVAAGELALRRSAAIIRGILQHYWAALLVGAVALGAILYLAVTYLGGAAKVWTSIAAIAGSLGITAQAVASTTARLAAEAERPVFAAAEEDAMAWAITTLPSLRLPPRRVHQLRKAGIAPTNSLGRI
jgi:hypothetical protein